MCVRRIRSEHSFFHFVDPNVVRMNLRCWIIMRYIEPELIQRKSMGKYSIFYICLLRLQEHWLCTTTRRGANWQFNAEQKPGNNLLYSLFFGVFYCHPHCSEFVAASKSSRNHLVNGKTKYECNVHRPVYVRFEWHSLIMAIYADNFQSTHKNYQVDGRTHGGSARATFCRPNYRYILQTRAQWMCTKLANRKWLKVRPANFLRFIVASPLPVFSSSIEVFVRFSQQLVNFKNDGQTSEVWCEFFSLSSLCVAYVCRVAELPINPWNLFYTTIAYFIGQHSLYIFVLCSVHQRPWLVATVCEHNFIHNVEDENRCMA